MSLFLGIDLGTTYFKAALFDEQGHLRGLGRRAVPKQGNGVICELQVESFWSALTDCVAQAMTAAGAHRSEIKALAYSSQANSFLLLDKSNQPLTPLILWPDARAGAAHPALSLFASQTGWGEKTGMGIGLSANSAVTKLMALQNEAVWKNTGTVCTLPDYLTLVLTGEKAADGSTASLTGLLDAQACRWWTEALDIAQLPDKLLAPVYRMGTPVGKLTHHGADRLGLHATTHYSLGGLDHHMAAIGAGIVGTSNLSESTGTVLAAVQSMETYQPQPDVCVAPGLYADHFFRMAFDGNGAGALEAYQQMKGIPMEALLASDDEKVVEILTSTANSLASLVAKLNGAGDIIATGGGARSKRWIRIKADILNKSFIIPACNEAACLGAAKIAALNAGAIAQVTEWTSIKEQIFSHQNDEQTSLR